MNKQRLRKLADFIEQLKPRKLDMTEIAVEDEDTGKMNPYKCKSVACAMGWTPFIFPTLIKYEVDVWCTLVSKKTGATDWDAMAEIFGLGIFEADVLFNAGTPSYHTPKQVAKGIRHFVDTGELPT